MSERTEDGGAAFPQKSLRRDEQGIDHEIREPGMSLRDWFAGQALAGVCANASWNDALHRPEAIEANVKSAYRHADAMIAARKGGAA